MIILFLALLLNPSVRAEESFQNSAESTIRSQWRKEILQELADRPQIPASLRPEISTQTRVTLRYSFEDRDGGWKDVATLSMTRRTFERYRDLERRWEEDAPLRRGFDEDPRRYFGSFGGRDALASADVIFTSLSNDPFVQAHPWLDEPISLLVGGLQLFERFDHGSILDVLGFEVNDSLNDHFGIGADRGRAPGLGGITGSSDGDFHGRLRIGVSGVERVATKFDGDPLKLKAKYEIRCPRNFILDRVEVGGEFRPFCHDSRDSLRVFIGGAKSF